jgi:hypothetical protein
MPSKDRSPRLDRRVSVWLVAALAAISLVAGLLMISTRRPPPPGLMGVAPDAEQMPVSAAASELKHFVDQLWAADPDGSGGYRTLGNLAAPVSLYQTGWAIRVANVTGLSIERLDRERVITWLDSVIRDAPNLGTPRWDDLGLATSALTALGERPPSIVNDELARHRIGSMFSDAPGGPAGWAATATGVELTLAAGGAIAPSLADQVLAALPGVTDRGSDQDTFMNELLPAWQVADRVLTAGEREPFRSAIEARLKTELKLLNHDLKPDALTLFVNANASEIAKANGLSLDLISVKAMQSLETDDGRLALSPSGGPDLQATYYGLEVGWPVKPELEAFLPLQATPAGWRDDAGTVDARTSYYATAISHIYGDHVRDSAMAKRMTTWLDQVAAASRDMEALRPVIGDALYAFGLAQELGMERPDSALQSVRAFLESGNAGTWKPAELSAAVRMASPLTSGDVSNLRTVASHWEAPTTMADAYDQWVVSVAIGAPDIETRAKAAANTLRVGAAFVAAPGVSMPDLRSTLQARRMLKLRQGGASAASMFLDGNEIWMFATGANQPKLASLETVYLELILDGLTSNPDDGVF